MTRIESTQSMLAGSGKGDARSGSWLDRVLTRGRGAPQQGKEVATAPSDTRGARLRFTTLVEGGFGVPQGAVVGPVASGSTLIRAAYWPAPAEGHARSRRGTVVILSGRSEFVEKYHEVVAELRGRGFAVVAFDWRGQGLSKRALADPRKGHVLGFGEYAQDVLAVLRQVVQPFCPKPWFALAHSMGGTVALELAAAHPGLFSRLVLSAPMIDIANLPFGDASRVAARLCRHGGLATRFVPGGRARSILMRGFAGNLLTSDERRFTAVVDLLRAEPRLSLGAPTIGWLHAAFRAMARLHAADFPLRMTTPTLALNPGGDRVVDPRATERLLARLRGSRVVNIPFSRHEILLERDIFRQQFWAAFDAFVPGDAVLRDDGASRAQ